MGDMDSTLNSTIHQHNRKKLSQFNDICKTKIVLDVLDFHIRF